MVLIENREITIKVEPDSKVYGSLVVPDGARGLILFAHGSGSSRWSIRNRHVAALLNQEGWATLLMDLLTPEEENVYHNRFDIEKLSARLEAVTLEMHKRPELCNLGIGYFGASTGAASAVKAAVRLGDLVKTVVSRGGRPDLATGSLGKLKCPVLLIVGSLDHDVHKLNRKAFSVIGCEKEIKIIEGASHLFEEKGKLEEVAVLAANWFKEHLK